MFKKIISLALALMMIMSIAAVAASAAQVEVPEVAAGADVAEQGAEGDVAETGLDAANCLNFDLSSAGWNNTTGVAFYMWPVGGEAFTPWGSKKAVGEETSSGIWSFDPNTLSTIESGQQYVVIFAQVTDAGWGMQTYNLVFDSSCLGDTAYCTGVSIENPEDSNKTAIEAKWRNSSLGSQKVVTSIGNVVGDTIVGTTAYEMFKNFLTNTLGNARTFSGKDDQTLLDDTAKALELTKDDVEKAISEAGVTADWSKDKSSLSGGSSDTSSTSGTSSSTSSSTSSTGTSSSSSSSSTTKSGSASNTQTGQEETMLFIMLGVMVVAAGVIFFTRKRERA